MTNEISDDAAIPLRDVPALFPESRFKLATLRAKPHAIGSGFFAWDDTTTPRLLM